MTVRKISIADTVKSDAQSKQSREKDSEPNMVKTTSLPKKKQNKQLSKIIKKFLQYCITGEGFRILK